MLIGYLIWPIWVTLFSGLVLWSSGEFLVERYCVPQILVSEQSEGCLYIPPKKCSVEFTEEDLAIGMALSFTVASVASIFIGITVGVASGIVGGLTASVLAGVLIGIIPTNIGLNPNGFPTFYVDPPLTALALAMVFGLTAGITGSIAFSISRSNTKDFPWRRQFIAVAGLILALLLCGGLGAVFGGPMVFILADWAAGDVFRLEAGAEFFRVFALAGLIMTTIIGVAIGLERGIWSRGFVFGLMISFALSVIGWMSYQLAVIAMDGIILGIGLGIAYGVAASALLAAMFMLPR
jgi:hypothetical protein